MTVFKVGLMGLGRGGQRVAELLINSSWCELVAAASPNTQRLEQFAADYPDIATFDDFRSMLVATPLDALFVAVPPHLRLKYLPLAAERNIPVWMLTPAARRFDEALELLQYFDKAQCPIVTSRIWGNDPALQPDSLDPEQIGRFFLARGTVSVCSGKDLDWRGDSQRAGGGVLMYRAYPMIDTLVQAMGMPSGVYARMAGISRPGRRFPYDTEDTAGLLCHFASGAMATLNACWTAGPTENALDLIGLAGTLHIDDRQVILRDRPGQHEILRQERSANPLQPQIETFFSELAGSSQRIQATLRQHLATIAVIEAAYLSAKTGQPESPATIFQMHDVEPPKPASL